MFPLPISHRKVSHSISFSDQTSHRALNAAEKHEDICKEFHVKAEDNGVDSSSTADFFAVSHVCSGLVKSRLGLHYNV